MNNLDLDINNYNLNDILRLFKLSIDFTGDDMKRAKKMVLMTHPDKSRLSPDVFLFYSKAYKILFYVYNFRKRAESEDDTEYSPDIENIKKSLGEEEKIKKFTASNDFNKKFNEIFESNRMADNDNDFGYMEWFKSDNDINTDKATNVSQMNTIIENKKKQVRELVVHHDFSALGENSNYDLTREKPENYSSDIFSKLPYEDLRKAHMESVIPVTEQDYLSRKHFSNVNELKNNRNSENLSPMDKAQVKEFLKKQEEKNIQIGSNVAFSLARQAQESTRINNNISRHFNRILN
tara:strand:- start:1756 stop:2634 length:879 start_codon:yes stop_codon:yes gene_type:complete